MKQNAQWMGSTSEGKEERISHPKPGRPSRKWYNLLQVLFKELSTQNAILVKISFRNQG